MQCVKINQNLSFCTVKEKVMYDNSYFDKIYDRITNHFNEMSVSEINEIYSQMNACPEKYKANALFIMGLLYIRHGVKGKGIENLKQASQLGNFMAVIELEKLNSNAEENAVPPAENVISEENTVRPVGNVISEENNKQNVKPENNNAIKEAMGTVECFCLYFDNYFPKEKIFSEGYNREDVYLYILDFTDIIEDIYEGKCTREQASEEIYEMNVCKNFRSSKMGGLVKSNVDSNIAELDRIYELLTGEKPRQGFRTENYSEGFLKKDVIEYIQALKYLMDCYEKGERTKEEFNYDLTIHRKFRKLRSVVSGGFNKNEVMGYINNLNNLADKLADTEIVPPEKPKNKENVLAYLDELNEKINDLENDLKKRKENKNDLSPVTLRTAKSGGYLKEDVLSYLDLMNELIANVQNGSVSKEDALYKIKYDAPLLRTVPIGGFVREDVNAYIDELKQVINNF